MDRAELRKVKAVSEAPVNQASAVMSAPTLAPRQLRRRVAMSSVYMVGARLGMRLIGLVSTLVLVRILSPADFGIVALAQAVYPILDLLTATGFNQAIIRMHAPKAEHYDTAWTLGIFRGAFIAIGLVATSGWQARFMHEPRIEPLMWVLAGTAFLASLQNVRLVDYQRDLRFEWITLFMLWGKVQGFIIIMLLAIFMHNYWILILANLFNKMISVPGSYIVARHRPRFSLAGWRDLFHFSKWLFLGNICLLTDMQLMNFVVGRYLGMVAVGLYQVGMQVAALPITEIAAPVRGPLYSAFSKVFHDIDQLRRTFLDSLAIQCLIILPLTVGLAVTAPEVTALFLGRKWMAVTPLLPIIAFYQLFDAMGHYTHTVMLALNRQRLYTITYYTSIALRVPLTIWWALENGLRGAAFAMLATAAVNAVLWSAQLGPLLDLRWRRAMTNLWRPVVAAAVMGGMVLIVSQWLPTGAGYHDMALRFFMQVVTGGIIYVTLVSLFWVMAGATDDAAEAQIWRSISAALERVATILQFSRRPVG
jgi:lipopolysaccharide exporter